MFEQLCAQLRSIRHSLVQKGRRDDVVWSEKCKTFLKNPQENFEKTNIVNFDIINRKIRGEKISDEFLKEYQTVQEKRVSQYLKKECQNLLACAFRRTGSISI